MKNRFKRKNYSKIIFTVFLIILIVVASITYIKMEPVIIRYAESVAETVMLDSANKAIVNILENGNITYTDIVNLSNNDEGYVTSLEIDVLQINNLKSKIASEISKIIANEELYDFSIPIGTFLGNTYTNGFGPLIKFKMQITTTAFVDFEHEFKSAGINQVLHIVNVAINIKGSLVTVGYRKGINAKTTAIAAQTVIVGKSPDAFTNVVESQTDNTGGLINDYGAIAE